MNGENVGLVSIWAILWGISAATFSKLFHTVYIYLFLITKDAI